MIKRGKTIRKNKIIPGKMKANALTTLPKATKMFATIVVQYCKGSVAFCKEFPPKN